MQHRRPDELVIAAMQPDPPPIEAPFPVRIVHVTGDRLPLAAARNAAVGAATGDGLVFLDVDCIPAPELVARYAACLADTDGCFMGEVGYLPFVPTLPLDMAAIAAAGVRHPAKPAPPAYGISAEPDHGELWGLSFALSRGAFERAGGFDERYVGYGGEETDFAWRLHAAGVPLYRTAGALALHQAHPVHIPPLHHFADIIANARAFRGRWGRWSMDYWLGQFAAAGLIRWSPDASAIDVLRSPSPAEVAASRAPEGTLFS